MINTEKPEEFTAETKKVNEGIRTFNKRRHGDRIKEICKTERITQEELAEIAGIDTKTVSRAVNGEGILSGYAVVRIYLELGYSSDWIYGISELSKDSERPYFVDIRDLIQIEEDKVKISIKEDLFRILEGANVIFPELQLDEDCAALCKGIEKQRRCLLYSHPRPNYYCACVDCKDFKLNTSEP